MRKQLTIGGRLLTWREAGAGEPLVLVHAFPLNADMWQPQLLAPPPGWRLIAPDLPEGTAEDRAKAASIDDYAADVVDLLDALKIRDAVIGGLSMGGYVTFALLRLAPQYFRGLVLSDTRATADTDEGRAARVKMQALADAEGSAGVARELVPKLLSGSTQRNRPEVMDGVRRMIEEHSVTGIKRELAAMMARPDSTPLLAGIHRPTLILVGAEDALTPVADAEAMHRGIAGSVLTVIPEAGHLSNLEAPDPFNHALASFLSTKV